MINYINTKNIDISELMMFLLTYATWKISKEINHHITAINNTTCLITAWDDGKIIGTARSLSDCARWATIVDVLVHPNYRNQGIGKKIIEELLECPEMKVRTVYLATENQESFYNKLGFQSIKGNCTYLIKVNKEIEHEFVLPVNV